MQTKLILVCILALLFSSYEFKAQNNLHIEYDVYANTESPRKLKSELFTEKSGSYFITLFGNANYEKKENTGTEYYFYSNKKKEILHTNYIDSILTSFTTLKSKKYQVVENTFSLKWQIDENSIKKILGYNCLKAMTSFRGREYWAWFTFEIPIYAGPWKFNGLPGLILEIHDTTNRFHWIATKVVKDYEQNPLKEQLQQTITDFKEINLKSFIFLKEGKRIDGLEKLSSRLPRGTTVETQYARAGIEVHYEWEKLN